MKKRQKLVLILYVNAVLFISFLYVPYVRHYTGCTERYIGHRLRFKIWDLTPWQSNYVGNITIDSTLIIAEFLAITAMAVVMFLLFNRDR